MTYDRHLRRTRAVTPPRDDVGPLRTHLLDGGRTEVGGPLRGCKHHSRAGGSQAAIPNLVSKESVAAWVINPSTFRRKDWRT